MRAETGGIDQRALRILEERAAALSRPLLEKDVHDGFEIIVVGCGAERYGIAMRWVHEVHPAGRVTPVPGAPGHFAGLINLRGTILPVLDLVRYLGLQEPERSPEPEVVLVGSAHDRLGFQVDEVLGLERVSDAEVRPPLKTSATSRNPVTGLTAGMVPMIDVEAILDDLLSNEETPERSRG